MTMKNNLVVTSLPIDWKTTHSEGEIELFTDNPDITIDTVRDLWMEKHGTTEEEWDEFKSLCHAIYVVPKKDFENPNDVQYSEEKENTFFEELDELWDRTDKAGYRKVWHNVYPLGLDNFGNVSIELDRELDHNKEYIDLGAIRIEANGRKFLLDIAEYDMSGTSITAKLVYNKLMLVEEFKQTGSCDEDCEWDLTPKDLFSPNIKAELYVDGESIGTPWEVKYMYVEVTGVAGIERLQLSEDK